MSDDDSHRGKSKGKKGGEGGGAKGKGGTKGKGGGNASGFNVNRVKVLPKFLQEIKARLKPDDAARGLDEAELQDKQNPVGRNDDDDYDIEGAQVVGSDYTAEELEVLLRRKPDSKRQPRTFFASEAPKPREEEDKPVQFRSKVDRDAAAKCSGSKRPAIQIGKRAIHETKGPTLDKSSESENESSESLEDESKVKSRRKQGENKGRSEEEKAKAEKEREEVEARKKMKQLGGSWDVLARGERFTGVPQQGDCGSHKKGIGKGKKGNAKFDKDEPKLHDMLFRKSAAEREVVAAAKRKRLSFDAEGDNSDD